MRIRNSRITILLLVLLVTWKCNNVKDDTSASGTITREILFPAGLVWMDTGIKVEIGKKIRITGGESAMGIPEVFNSDPVPVFSHGGLIGRIGKNGYPFVIGKYKEILGNSHNHGEILYVGRNDNTDITFTGINYLPVDLTIRIDIEDNNAPGLISPRDGAWSSNTLPTFDWDDVDDAVSYTIELSTFPDFRLIEQSVTTAFSYAQTAMPNTGIFPQQVPPTQPPPTFTPLPEGIHYWRVRAEFNAGRALSPDFDWTDWSVVYSYGVELGTSPSAPVIINPSSTPVVAPGSSVLVEFIESPDPSGVVWRYWLKRADCGQTPQIDSQQDKPLSYWRMFYGTYEVYDPNTPPQLYASLETGTLEKGNWLLRIEVRDGSDPEGTNSSSTDLNINAGCEQ